LWLKKNFSPQKHHAKNRQLHLAAKRDGKGYLNDTMKEQIKTLILNRQKRTNEIEQNTVWMTDIKYFV
jgi:hypothetical protein